MFGAIRWRYMLLLVLFTGCSASNEVVTNGSMQKRKYRPGWHLDLRLGNHRKGPSEEKGVQRVMVERLEPRTLPGPSVGEPVASRTPTDPYRPMGINRLHRPLFHTITVESPDPASHARTLPDTADAPFAEPRRWNRMAIVSGVFLGLSLLVMAAGGGPFLGYVLTFSFLTGLIGLLLCIKHKERGKGIAIAAMAFPIALLAAVIIALNSVW